MSNYQPYLHNRPTGSKEELKAFANETICTFFKDYNLDDCHENLWQIIKQSFFIKNWQLSKAQRANLVDFYESLHKMILASSILYNRQEDNEN